MKKILLLLCALLGTVGAWSAVTSITDGGLYTIQFKKNSWYFSPTLKTSQSNAGTFRFDVAGTGLYNIYSVEEGKYLTRPDAPANGGTPSLSETLEDTDNFKWVVAYDGSDWRIKTSNEAFCLNGWTNTLAETNDVKFYSDATHDLAPLILTSAEQKAAKAKTDAWTELITSTSTGLLSSSNQWVSPAADASEGWLDRLTDGNLTNYFHSDWHGAFSGTHYIEATLPEATNSLHLYYYTRSTGTGCPTNITVSVSTDGETWVDNVATINESDMPKAASKPYLSKGLTFDASYSHFRFYVPSTNSGNNSWFCLAEANLYAATSATAEAMALAHVDAADLTAEQIARINALDTELRSTIVNVTYNLYESDGTTLVDTRVVEQEKNSEAVNPFTVSNYFTYATEGTIGTDDCTIKVIRTLKANVVYPISNLSNNKAYTLTTARGTLGTNGTQMVSTNGTSFTASNFAIINYEEKFYLYSIADSKFVSHNTQPTLTDNIEEVSPITLALTDLPYYFMKMGNNGVNVAGGYGTGIVVNSYVTQDPGNQYVIEEAGDFDPAEALAALEEFFHPSNYYDRVEAAVLPFLIDAEGNPSPTIGKPFGLSTGAARNINQTYQTQLKAGTFTQEEYEGIVALKDAGIIYPEAGKFYLVKNNYNGKYMRVEALSTRGAVLADLTAEEAAKDASAHFYFTENNSKLYMTSQGAYLNWVYGQTNNCEGWAGPNIDKYVHFAAPAPGVGAFSIAYGNGVDSYASYLGKGFYALKNSGTTVVAGSSTDETSELAQWTFEEVSTLTVPLNGPFEDKSYATFCAPFDVTIGEGAQAYRIELGNNWAKYYAIEGNKVPAGTGVLLISGTAAESVTATINTNDAFAALSETNDLVGYNFEQTLTETQLVLGNNDEDGIGFYKMNGTASANKAYLNVGSEAVKGFRLINGDDFETAITAIESSKDGQIFDLSGRRVSKPAAGLYIKNGKKVAIK